MIWRKMQSNSVFPCGPSNEPLIIDYVHVPAEERRLDHSGLWVTDKIATHLDQDFMDMFELILNR